MTATFNRRIRVEVRDPNSSDAVIIPETNQLNIGFTVERNLNVEPSTAAVVIHNLTRDNQDKLQGTSGWTLRLWADYGQIDIDRSLIFEGDVRFVRHMREPPEIRTEIEAADGDLASGKFVTRHFGKGVSVATVFRFLQSSAGLGEGNVGRISAIRTPDGLPDRLENGTTVRGYVVDEMNDIARSRGAIFSIQDNEVLLLQPGEAKPGVPGVKVAPNTGLQGYPSLDNEGIVTFTHRLSPRIVPGAPVVVESEYISATFVCERSVYSGSLWGDDFLVEVEGREIAA